MSCVVYKNGEVYRRFENIIDLSIFLDRTVDQIEKSIENDEEIAGYKVRC